MGDKGVEEGLIPWEFAPSLTEGVQPASKYHLSLGWCHIRLRFWADIFWTALAGAWHKAGVSWQREPQWGRGVVG